MNSNHGLLNKAGLVFKDSIPDVLYGCIPYTEVEDNIIRSDYFSNLKLKKQLGTGRFVYNATHTRFEHSLGTMHLAGLMIDGFIGAIICEDTLKKDIVQTIRLAALLHDIGHGPYSHVFEQIISRNYSDERFRSVLCRKKSDDNTVYCISHEEQTTSIINSNAAHIRSSFATAPSNIIEIINNIIEKGEFAWETGLSEYRCLGRIVSGDIDADRIDYILRDTHHIGSIAAPINISPFELINNLKLEEDGYGNYDIVYKIDSSDNNNINTSELLLQAFFLRRHLQYLLILKNSKIWTADLIFTMAVESVAKKEADEDNEKRRKPLNLPDTSDSELEAAIYFDQNSKTMFRELLQSGYRDFKPLLTINLNEFSVLDKFTLLQISLVRNYARILEKGFPDIFNAVIGVNQNNNIITGMISNFVEHPVDLPKYLKIMTKIENIDIFTPYADYSPFARHYGKVYTDNHTFFIYTHIKKTRNGINQAQLESLVNQNKSEINERFKSHFQSIHNLLKTDVDNFSSLNIDDKKSIVQACRIEELCMIYIAIYEGVKSGLQDLHIIPWIVDADDSLFGIIHELQDSEVLHSWSVEEKSCKREIKKANHILNSLEIIRSKRRELPTDYSIALRKSVCYDYQLTCYGRKAMLNEYIMNHDAKRDKYNLIANVVNTKIGEAEDNLRSIFSMENRNCNCFSTTEAIKLCIWEDCLDKRTVN